MNDPWQHRSSRMRCSTCMWSSWKMGDVGRCRRHAPTINGYPVIFLSQDWCGDHKIDEEKYLPEISVGRTEAEREKEPVGQRGEVERAEESLRKYGRFVSPRAGKTGVSRPDEWGRSEQ